MSDNGFVRLDRLKTALSRVKTKVDSDIASAISESTTSLTSVINSGDASTLSEAKGYADGLKIIIDSNISGGDSSTLTSANSYTDSKISSVNSTINDLSESIPGQIALALEDYTEYSDFSDHISDTSNPHSVTYTQTGAAAASHTHVEADITDLGNYANSSHTHTVLDITDASTELAAKSHTHTTSEITNFGNYANSSHTHVEADITDLGSYASSSHTHTESDITDLGNYSLVGHTHSKSDITDVSDLALASDLTNHTGNTNNPHSVTYSQVGAAPTSHTHVANDITDASTIFALSSHNHTLSNITDITATATEVNTLNGITATTVELNNTANSISNIQSQINDARFYGFFSAWEYNHEYNVEDCIKIPCCTTTQYLECMVNGVTGVCQEYPIYDENDSSIITGYKKLDEFESVSNGQCIVDGTCVWIVQDIRDTRPIGSITPLLWRPMTTYNAFDNYGIGLINSTRYYDGRSNQQSNMLLAKNLKYIRLVKRIIGSAIFTLSESRLFRLFSNYLINNSITELSHISGALIILDWCIRPFTYLDSSNYNNIDERAYDYINLILSNYNSIYSVNLTKSQIIYDAINKKTKIYNNQLTEDYLYLENNAIGKYSIMQSGNYGIFQDAGLPNLSGSIGYIHSHGTTSNLPASNSLLKWVGGSNKSNSTYQYTTASGYTQYSNINFDARRGNSIYGNSTTVQPNTLQVYYYMKY